ncbi:MAG: glycosyltransferase family 2 protein [Pseudomonadota bacterium]|nr:glycosyltransferase family 2 protein [Pseudomonadota bacterium]
MSMPVSREKLETLVKITVVTAVWNAAETITDALMSVLGQDHPDIELLVMDGGSTDGTQSRVAAISDTRLRMVSEPDKGIYDALNKGLAAATGEVVGFVHADDILAGPHVMSQVARAFDDAECDLTYGDLDYVSATDTNKIIRHWRAGDFSRGKLQRGWMPPHPTVYARRALYERIGPYDTTYRIAADYDALLRMFGSGAARATYIPETLVKMRMGGVSNRNFREIRRKTREDLRAVRSNGVGGAGTIAAKNLRKVPQFFLR